MKAHTHVEIVTAKANNMDLVALVKTHEGVWREVLDQSEIKFKSSYEYFLCLPKHKEAVLHVLNGGIIQITINSPWYYTDNIDHIGKWRNDDSVWYMSPYCQSRIKPKKEKRWIGIHESGETTDACISRAIAVNHAMTENTNEWQFIEIEIEV